MLALDFDFGVSVCWKEKPLNMRECDNGPCNVEDVMPTVFGRASRMTGWVIDESVNRS